MRVFRRRAKILPSGEAAPIVPSWSPRGGGVLLPIPEETKDLAQAFAKRVDELVKKHTQAIIPMAIQAELQLRQRQLDEASTLYYEMSQAQSTDPALQFVKEFRQAREKLTKHIEKLRARIKRLQEFLRPKRPEELLQRAGR